MAAALNNPASLPPGRGKKPAHLG